MNPMSRVAGSYSETLIVETPERVELFFSLASLGNRFLACAIDHSLQLIALLIVLLAGDFLGTMPDLADGAVLRVSPWLRAFGILFVFILFFGYFALFETIWNGQTPGKRWLGLRVIQQDGRPVTFFSILTRNVLRIADMVVPPFYSVGLLAVFFSRYSKRLGDLVANTVVIKERPAAFSPHKLKGSPFTSLDESPDELRVKFEGDITLVTPAELLVAEVCLRRTSTLSPSSREWLAWRVAIPLMEKIKPRYEREGFTYEGFLRELLSRSHLSTQINSSGKGRSSGRVFQD